MKQINTSPKLDFCDVLMVPIATTVESRSKVSLTTDLEVKVGRRSIDCIPVMNSNMDHTGTIEMSKVLAANGMVSVLHKHLSASDVINYMYSLDPKDIVFYSLGMCEKELERFNEVQLELSGKHKPIEYVCLDVANGYMVKFVEFVKRFHDLNPNVVIMAGNVVTSEGVQSLADAGADIVKVGIGGGSACTTRKKTGVGYPQLSALQECADMADKCGAYICADGGIIEVGDIAKAIAIGADLVMCGGLFAGHTECGGAIEPEPKLSDDSTFQISQACNRFKENPSNMYQAIHIAGKSVVLKFRGLHTPQIVEPKRLPLQAYDINPNATMEFRGMSSEDALNKHYGGKAGYRTAEGKTVKIPYKGDVQTTIDDILGGLRSACSYTNSSTITDLFNNAEFIVVNRQLNESLSRYEK